MAAHLSLHNLTVSYDRRPAVHHLCGEFRAGSLTAVAGPNGGGKSTLLRAIVGLVRIEQGGIEKRLPAGSRIAWLSQQSRLDPTFPITVRELAALGLWPQLQGWRGVRRAHQSKIDAALAAVGLEGFQSRLIGSLSAGQLQRALFSRLLLQDAELILLDEPFNAIDARTTADLIQMIHAWHGEQRTVIAVLHDLEQIARHFPQTLLLARQAIAWGSTPDALTEHNLQRARSMAECWQAEPRICRAGAA